MRYAASAIGNAGSLTHALLSVLEGIGVNFIDLVSYGNGKGSVGATHPDQAAFDAACETAGKVFTEMIEEGLSLRTR